MMVYLTWTVIAIIGLGLLLAPSAVANDVKGREPVKLEVAVAAKLISIAVNLYVVWLIWPLR